MELDRLARTAVDCGFRLHKEIGPGLLESVYEVLLALELAERGLAVRRQVSVPIWYKGVVIDNAFKADLLVEGRLLIELKSVERNAPVHGKQVLPYLRLMGPARLADEFRHGDIQRRPAENRKQFRGTAALGATSWRLRVLA